MPESGKFADDAESFRRELLAHCYRMLGSVHDAEDLVQETYLRAWRAFDQFEGRASLRTWLYRIATNACLTALEQRGRRALPSGLAGPTEDPYAPPVPVGPEIAWLQPIPDALVRADDPAAIVAERDSLRLALIASLQYLPARQRAVLLLRDVLAFPAGEVAEMLDLSVAAVKSLLQRARARLDQVAPAADEIVEPTDPHARALLDGYIAAFENADPAALERVLRQDATLEATGSSTWFAGMRTCVPYLVAQVFGDPGDWRMIPTTANGQPAVVAYWHGQPYGVGVLTVTPEGIARIVAFGDADLVATWGYPPTPPVRAARR